MSALEAIFFGIIQGLAEFLPISSSGHLAFFHNVFGTVSDRMTFDLLLHLGTLCSVCIVYYRDILGLIVAFFSLCKKTIRARFIPSKISLSSDEKMLVMLVIALVPLVIGAVIEGAVEFVGTYTVLIGILWIINGVILFVSDRIAAKRRKDNKTDTEKSKTLWNALKVGLCQLLAIFPGISRSGMTITGGLLCGFDREFAVKFSFILSVPAILGANILSVGDALKESFDMTLAFPYLCGMLAALLSGLLAIKLLSYISKKQDFRIFSVYSFFIGILAIILGTVL